MFYLRKRLGKFQMEPKLEMYILQYFRMIEHAGHFRKNGFDTGRKFLAVKYIIRETFDQGLSPNTNVTKIVTKLLLVKSKFDSDHLDGASRRRPVGRAEQKTVLLTTEPLSKFSLLRRTALDFRMDTKLNAKAFKRAPKHCKFFRCKSDDIFFSNAKLSVPKFLALQVVHVYIDINDSENF